MIDQSVIDFVAKNLPGTDLQEYIMAAKLGAAIKMARQKVADAGMSLDDIPPEGAEIITKWVIRMVTDESLNQRIAEAIAARIKEKSA